MGREARIPRVPEPPRPLEVVELEATAGDPWWLPTVLPDLGWARELLAERDRRRARARQALAVMMSIALGGR